jgi:hypothetical protein
MAQGLYTPDRGTGVTLGDRSATFQIVNGMAIRGGYAGSGAKDPDSRDVVAWPTILTGDLNGDDGPDFANHNENSYHVVTCVWTDETTILDGLTITGGRADGIGGEESFPAPRGRGAGLNISNASPTLIDCVVRDNFARWQGAGVYNSDGDCTLTNCIFSGNRSRCSGGGGMYNKGDSILANCTFTSNSAYYDGGGMYNAGGNPALTKCTFSYNSAEKGGGMYSNYDSGPTLTNCTFKHNSAMNMHMHSLSPGGGGIYIDRSIATLTDCTFHGNTAEYDGGGVFSSSRRDGSLHSTLTNCVFTNNSAERGGGMSASLIYSGQCRHALTNCLFSGNSAVVVGGAIRQYYGDMTLINCTLSGNWARWGAGGMHNDSRSSSELTNCILWNNKQGDLVDEFAQIYGGDLLAD